MTLSRRALLASGVVVAAACREQSVPSPPDAEAPGPPFTQLVRALGPWPPGSRDSLLIAEAFERGLAPKPPAGVDLASLAPRCLASRRAVGAVDLASLSEPERAFVLDFAAALYRIPDVLAALTGAEPEGSCPADPLAYTRAPG